MEVLPMNRVNPSLFMAIFIATAFTQSFAQEKGSFTDARDKKAYKIVKIGSQTWMAENLDYHGEDGFLGLCYGDWPKEKIRKPENCKKYGRLYDWKEAMTACPAGWHLPTKDEWQKLLDFAGGESPNAPKCKYKEDDKIDDRGRTIIGKEYDKCTTDEYGFAALPGGFGYPGGYFDDVGYYGFWWSASEVDSGYAYYRRMYDNIEYANWNYYDKSFLFSVRCLQD
jgi:uncharacterized protein (TIGR02145 family)